MSKVTTITSGNIEEFIKGTPVAVVKFGAQWCGPCRTMHPAVEAVAEEGYAIGDVNVDDEQELALKFAIRSVPTTIFFKDGEPVNTSVGALTKEKIIETINSL